MFLSIQHCAVTAPVCFLPFFILCWKRQILSDVNTFVIILGITERKKKFWEISPILPCGTVTVTVSPKQPPMFEDTRRVIVPKYKLSHSETQPILYSVEYRLIMLIPWLLCSHVGWQRWRLLKFIMYILLHTTIVQTQVDFQRRVEIDSWILMSHIWHDMTSFSV